MSAAQGSIVVRAPVGDVYRQWLRVEDFPKFVPAVKEVQKLDGGHFAIVFSFNGKRHEGVLEIMLRAPERRLAWRALAGGASNYLASGVVSLPRVGCTTICAISKDLWSTPRIGHQKIHHPRNSGSLIVERKLRA